MAHFLRKGRSSREARRKEERRGRGELLVLFSTIGLHMVRVKLVIHKVIMMILVKILMIKEYKAKAVEIEMRIMVQR